MVIGDVYGTNAIKHKAICAAFYPGLGLQRCSRFAVNWRDLQQRGLYGRAKANAIDEVSAKTPWQESR
jgi:hypothetical protein